MHKTYGPVADLLENLSLFTASLACVLEPRLVGAAAGQRIEASHWSVLELAGRANSTPVRELASYLGVGAPALRQAIRALEASGLAQRAGSALTLTARGRKALARYRAARQQALARIFAAVPEAKIRVAAQVLGTLGASVVTATASPEEICRDCAVYFKERCLVQEVASQRG